MALVKPTVLIVGLIITLGIVFLTFNLGKTSGELRKNASVSESKNDIEQSQIEVLSWSPRVLLYRNFISEEECDYIIKKGIF